MATAIPIMVPVATDWVDGELGDVGVVLIKFLLTNSMRSLNVTARSYPCPTAAKLSWAGHREESEENTSMICEIQGMIDTSFKPRRWWLNGR